MLCSPKQQTAHSRFLADRIRRTPIIGVSHVGGYRIITLDSSVPGRTHGFVDATQLRWLRSVLAIPSGHGSVVVIHHPPVEPVSALHQGIELINAGELAQALAGSDTVAILSGHYHHHLSDSLATNSGPVPVIVTSGIVNSNDVLARPGHERALAGSGGSLITISATSGTSASQHGTVARVRTLPFRFQLPAADGCSTRCQACCNGCRNRVWPTPPHSAPASAMPPGLSVA